MSVETPLKTLSDIVYWRDMKRSGIVFAVETELGIPVKLVGVGEQVGDLIPFHPDEFVNALFDSGTDR